jgi:hypothetical protein
MEFKIKASALKRLDDPVTVRFFVWVVCNSVTVNKILVINGLKLSLRPGQMLFSRDAATKALHQHGYTEREVLFAAEKCRVTGLIKKTATEYGPVLSLNESAVSLEGNEMQVHDGIEAQALEIIQYHQQVHPNARGHKKSGPTWKKILATLKDGYSVHDLKCAIDGNANDPWWKKKNLHALALILREQHLPRFISAGKGKQTLAERWIDNLDTANSVIDAEPEWSKDETGRPSPVRFPD